MDPARTTREMDRRGAGDAGVPAALRLVAGWSWRILAVLTVAVAIGFVTVKLHVLFVALFVALLVSALLEPGMRLLLRLRVPRPLAAALILLSAVAVVVGVLYLAGLAVAGQAGELLTTLTDGFEKIRTWVEGTFGLSTDQLMTSATGMLKNFMSGGGAGSGVFGAAGTVLDVAAGAGIALFATIFFVYDGPRIWAWATSLFPARARTRVDEAGRLSWLTLASYARATVIIAAIDAIGIGVGVALIGVPLAAPIAVVVFFGAFIPVVGATLSGLVAVVIALATQGLTAALLVAGVVLLVQQVEGHVLQPLVQGKFVAIHPLAIVLAVAAGSIVAGLIGAVIAVPVVAVGNVLVRYAARISREGAPGAAPDQVPGQPV